MIDSASDGQFTFSGTLDPNKFGLLYYALSCSRAVLALAHTTFQLLVVNVNNGMPFAESQLDYVKYNIDEYLKRSNSKYKYLIGAAVINP